MDADETVVERRGAYLPESTNEKQKLRNGLSSAKA